jgi:hypothetical protein
VVLVGASEEMNDRDLSEQVLPDCYRPLRPRQIRMGRRGLPRGTGIAVRDRLRVSITVLLPYCWSFLSLQPRDEEKFIRMLHMKFVIRVFLMLSFEILTSAARHSVSNEKVILLSIKKEEKMHIGKDT